MKKIRVGEKQLNNYGELMEIVNYINCDNIDVYFPKYDCFVFHRGYSKFKKGQIRCPYSKTIYKIGFIGSGKFNTKENGKITKPYEIWRGMIRRCYSQENKKSFSTYKDCTVCDEWHNFQNFAEWFEENYYEVEGERMELDKDILIKGNKIYSPETCVFVPSGINNIFTKSDVARGDLPIGISFQSSTGNYIVSCNANKKQNYLGSYNDLNKAFNAYKNFKENYIKEVAEKYVHIISTRLYKAMISYKVDIED